MILTIAINIGERPKGDDMFIDAHILANVDQMLRGVVSSLRVSGVRDGVVRPIINTAGMPCGAVRITNGQ